MRPLLELIDRNDPGWPIVQQWIGAASVAVEILPTEPEFGEASLYATQVTSRSPMGAIVLNAAGILIDHGWLRVLGAGGHPRFQRSLPGWNEGRSNGFYLIADDAVGGFFALNGGALGDVVGKVYFYAPDSLRWEPCGCGYSDFLVWAMSGDLGKFYQSLRWSGWESEIEKLTADQTMGVYPFLFASGPPINERYRAPVPVAEQYTVQFEMQRQISG